MIKQRKLKTERLILKRIKSNQWKKFLDRIIGTDDFCLYFGMDKNEVLLEMIRKPVKGVLYYAIIKKGTKEMTGIIGFSLNNKVEFYTFKEHRNKNYCSEALKAFADACLKGKVTGKKCKCVFAETLESNGASARVLEKAGFEFVCSSRSIFMKNENDDKEERQLMFEYYG